MTLESAGELIEYIHAHAHNFSQNNVTATQEYDRLFSKAKVMAREELSLYGTDAFYRKWKNGDAISNNLLYEIMTGENPSGKSGTTTRFKSANLPKEIKNRFPEAGTLSKSNMTYEERRKVIILLFSYHMWCIVQIKGDTAVYEYDDYKAELDACLDDCNFPPLYYGNPYDWLFLYCAQAERPLDTFREILSEVLESDFN